MQIQEKYRRGKPVDVILDHNRVDGFMAAHADRFDPAGERLGGLPGLLGAAPRKESFAKCIGMLTQAGERKNVCRLYVFIGKRAALHAMAWVIAGSSAHMLLCLAA